MSESDSRGEELGRHSQTPIVVAILVGAALIATALYFGLRDSSSGDEPAAGPGAPIVVVPPMAPAEPEPVTREDVCRSSGGFWNPAYGYCDFPPFGGPKGPEDG